MRTLYLIPARGGSKGLPGKNIKLLNGKALIAYSIEFALEHMQAEDEICVSTDDESVMKIADQLGVKIQFKRPFNLSSDTAKTEDVIIHALNWYKEKDIEFETIMLLQPTSPFRTNEDFIDVKNAYNSNCDMVVTVKESKENPYFTLFEENEEHLLFKCKGGDFSRRQDCPKVYAFNGSIYFINVASILSRRINKFTRIKKVLMPEKRSIDIDTIADWILAEHYSNII